MASVSQADDQLMVAGPMARLVDVDFGRPLHCLVIAGSTLHELEQQMLGLIDMDKLLASERAQLRQPPPEQDAADSANDDSIFRL
jgi:hypothetical protein